MEIVSLISAVYSAVTQATWDRAVYHEHRKSLSLNIKDSMAS